jgi:thiosulfate/3-mercaptopyruvate sulfurtransferase
MKAKYSILFLLTILVSIGAKAQDFITVAELSKKLNDKNTIIVSARSSSEYKQVHIRNAVSLPVSELSNDTPVKGILKSPEELAKIFGDKGIAMDKDIVLYCNKGNSAGRMYWIMKYMGYPNVKILDGSIGAWKEGRKPVTRAPKMLPKVVVKPNLNPELLVAKADVIKAKGQANTVVVDARIPNLFAGTDPTSKGHIPGAINVDSEELKDDKGILKSADELGKLYASKGVTKDKEVILYCQTSTRAGLEFAVLTSVLNYPNVKVYDGAYNEWSADSGLKLEN